MAIARNFHAVCIDLDEDGQECGGEIVFNECQVCGAIFGDSSAEAIDFSAIFNESEVI